MSGVVVKRNRQSTGMPQFATAAFADAATENRRRFGRFNLGIVGETGVGKSSLVNAVFGEARARVGVGLPVTRGVNYYHEGALGIWDFEGFEIGGGAPQLLRENLRKIAERPADEQISVVWYCVLSSAGRLTRTDIAMINELEAAGLPVIIVLTKVDWDRNPVTGKMAPSYAAETLKQWIENPRDEVGRPITIHNRGVVLTSAVNSKGKGVGYGLSDLVERTLELSPASEKDAFRIVQTLNLGWKRDMARRDVTAATASAAAAAAVPIPIATAAVLAPIQLAMMGRVAVVYDLELRSVFSVSALAQLATQMTGRALAASLVKFIPGAGSVIDAAVASALTAATGEGWIRFCEAIYTGKVDLRSAEAVWQRYAPTAASVFAQWAAAKRTKAARQQTRGSPGIGASAG